MIDTEWNTTKNMNSAAFFLRSFLRHNLHGKAMVLWQNPDDKKLDNKLREKTITF